MHPRSRPSPPPAGTSDLLRRADARRAKGRLDQAESLYRQAVRADPSDARAVFGLGRIQAEQGRHTEAVPHLAAALKADATASSHWFALADALLAQSRLPEMRALLLSYAGRDWAGADLADRGRFVTRLLAHGLRYHAEQRLEAAEAVCDVAVLLDSGNADALHLAACVALDSGRLDLAESLAGLAIDRNAEVAGIHRTRGIVLNRQGRLVEAADSLRLATALDPRDAQTLNNLGSTCQDLGEFAEAERHLRDAVALRPDYALAWNNLGLALANLKRPEDAVAAYERALAIQPDYATALCHLGLALADLGRADVAEARMRAAIRLDPEHAFARNNLGNLLRESGRLQEALAEFETARTLRPDVADIHSNLGTVLLALDRTEEAKACLIEAVRIAPADANLRYNLGNCFAREFRFRQALDEYARAVEAKPDFIEALNNVADAYRIMTLTGEAEAALRQAIAIDPTYVAAHNNLGNVLKAGRRFEEAAEAFEAAVALAPTHAPTLINLAGLYGEMGRRDDAMRLYERASACRDDSIGTVDLREIADSLELLRAAVGAHGSTSIRAITGMAAYSHALFQRLYRDDVGPDEMAEDARHFGRTFCDPLLRQRPFRNDRDPERRLRVGFVSGDLRQHSVNYFFEPALRNLPPDAFETFAYSNTILVDEATDRLRELFDHWTCIRRIDDDTAADRIEADGIDILVDLSGHTAGNRLGIFARKPAPVQFTWIGYPGTIGMTAIDYRLGDVTEPEGDGEGWSVETLWRVPRLSFCYQAHPLCPEPADRPPFEGNGFVTFGSFNNASKLSDSTLDAWSRILADLPDARLLCEIAGIETAKVRGDVERRFAAHGLPLDRIDFEPRTPENRFVLYRRVDVCLDPFPYNGGTTSLDTLYMGVPFVSLTGRHCVARLGFGILESVGLAELSALSVDGYVDTATALARDPDRLRRIRHGLRDRMAASPAMDHAGLGAMLGDAFRGMWRRWADVGPDGADGAVLSIR